MAVSIYDDLKAAADADYKDFQSKLVPNISPDCVIGVRTPAMRDIAKKLYKSGEYGEFLDSLPHKWYEENLVHFFVISFIKDFDECVKRTEQFLPYVDCWPVSDQSSPKVFKKHHEKLLPLIKKWISSDHVYTARFGIRMLMNEFLGDDFKDEYLELVSMKAPGNINEGVKSGTEVKIKTNDKESNKIDVPVEASDDYYLRMMVAWYFATALAKQYDAAVKYMEDATKLDEWTRRKAIQKAIESYRVSDEHKDYLRSLR
ncbi:MAG: DNA alkylation repair protein [Lachnospiraceae bacterium]|nr:DNA alkylation repair protein [Lachnospiraceae bacterium]